MMAKLLIKNEKFQKNDLAYMEGLICDTETSENVIPNFITKFGRISLNFPASYNKKDSENEFFYNIPFPVISVDRHTLGDLIFLQWIKLNKNQHPKLYEIATNIQESNQSKKQYAQLISGLTQNQKSLLHNSLWNFNLANDAEENLNERRNKICEYLSAGIKKSRRR